MLENRKMLVYVNNSISSISRGYASDIDKMGGKVQTSVLIHNVRIIYKI
jgi:hypothetical protein